jgi:hypothetical protein
MSASTPSKTINHRLIGNPSGKLLFSFVLFSIFFFFHYFSSFHTDYPSSSSSSPFSSWCLGVTATFSFFPLPTIPTLSTRDFLWSARNGPTDLPNVNSSNAGLPGVGSLAALGGWGPIKG